MTFRFTPGPPKPSRAIEFDALRCSPVKITGAKTVGNAIVKLYSAGEENYYIEDSCALRAWLATCFGVFV